MSKLEEKKMSPAASILSIDSSQKTLRSSVQSVSQFKELDIMEQFSEQFDYVLVLPIQHDIGIEKAIQTAEIKRLLHLLIQAGFELFPYVSTSKTNLFVLCRCSVYRDLVEKNGFKLIVNPLTLEMQLKKGDASKRITPVTITHSPAVSKISPYDYVYLPYQSENNELYNLYSGQKHQLRSIYSNDKLHPFDKNIRLKLIYFMLTNSKRNGGCGIELLPILHQGLISAAFPLHEQNNSKKLLNYSMKWKTMPWDYPNDEIKNYFGEKIALYWEFINHYTIWIIPLIIIGLTFQCVVWVTSNYSHPILAFFCIFIACWSSFMLSYWKQKESCIALEWGMLDFTETSEKINRPQFIGRFILKSHIDGKEMIYFPHNEFERRLFLSLSVVLAFVGIVIGVIAAIYILQFTLQRNINQFSYIVSSSLNGLQITIFNIFYQWIGVHLTERENHRTDLSYEHSLILKVFVFQFVNSYASFFYLAFVAPYLVNTSADQNADYLGQCGYYNCMVPLAINLGVILFARVVGKNLLDFLLPLASYYIRTTKYCNTLYQSGVIPHTRTRNQIIMQGLITPPESQHLLLEYSSILENVKNFTDSTVQYGYTILFITALPCAPLFTIIHCYVKCKSDMYKLLQFYQRPTPKGVRSIETWYDVLTLLSIIGVITNAGVVCFTMDLLDQYSAATRIWIFLGFQWTLILLQMLIGLFIDPLSEEVEIQKERISFIHRKIIDKEPDEDFDYYADFDFDEEGELLSSSNAKSESFKQRNTSGLSFLTYNRSQKESNRLVSQSNPSELPKKIQLLSISKSFFTIAKLKNDQNVGQSSSFYLTTNHLITENQLSFSSSNGSGSSSLSSMGPYRKLLRLKNGFYSEESNKNEFLRSVVRDTSDLNDPTLETDDVNKEDEKRPSKNDLKMEKNQYNFSYINIFYEAIMNSIFSLFDLIFGGCGKYWNGNLYELNLSQSVIRRSCEDTLPEIPILKFPRDFNGNLHSSSLPSIYTKLVDVTLDKNDVNEQILSAWDQQQYIWPKPINKKDIDASLDINILRLDI